MFCKNCGNPIGDGEQFCRSCGAAVSGQPAPSVSAETPKSQSLVTCAWFAPAAIILCALLNRGLMSGASALMSLFSVSSVMVGGIVIQQIINVLAAILTAAVTVGLYFAAFSKQPKSYRTAAFFSVAASTVVGWVLNPISGIISSVINGFAYHGYGVGATWHTVLLFAVSGLMTLASAVATYFLVREYYKRLEVILQNRDK